MISDEKWNEAVNNSADCFKKKYVRVIETNGAVFIGICNGYCEDDDGNGNACWTILVGWRKFFQKEIESIELMEIISGELEKAVEELLLSGYELGKVVEIMMDNGYSKDEVWKAISECSKKHIKSSSNIFD